MSTETAAQARMFLDTLSLLADKKLNGAAASALLFGQAVPVIRELLALIETDAECACCEVSYPLSELTDGTCPVCVKAGCEDEPVPAAAAPVPGLDVADALPMLAADGDFCGWANPGHLHQTCTAKDGHPENWHALHGAGGRVVEFWPVTEAPHPGVAPRTAGRITCTAENDGWPCTADPGHEPLDHGCWSAEGALRHSWPAAPARPASWVCSRCQRTLPGRKPEDGICRDCEPPAEEDVPPVSLALVQGVTAEGGE